MIYNCFPHLLYIDNYDKTLLPISKETGMSAAAKNDTRLLLADDHQSVRQGYEAALKLFGLTTVGHAEDGLEAIAKSKELRPDVVLLDINMPKVNGIEAAKQIKWALPDIGILILTMYDNRHFVDDALSAGVDGYIIKMSSIEILAAAIKKIVSGETYYDPAITRKVLKESSERIIKAGNPEQVFGITARELEVLSLMLNGLTSVEISEELGISRYTVNNHRKSILAKCKVKTTAELVKTVIESGIAIP